MPKSLNNSNLEGVEYLVGDIEVINEMQESPSKRPFDEDILNFLSFVSKIIMADSRSRMFSDVITFAFYIRLSSTMKLKSYYEKVENDIIQGKGLVFHIAPSNVPVNFAYSMAAGLFTGNKNIIRVPSKDFEQIDIIADAINKALEEDIFKTLRNYIVLVRYNRDKMINDVFSDMADIRIIWGGDSTIANLRQSPLRPRTTEITFADRYSLAVINSECYLSIDDKEGFAEKFYNDTLLTDQNACTSPRIIIWTGEQKDEAKERFWSLFEDEVKKKYKLQDIQGVNKLTKLFLTAEAIPGIKLINNKDNFIYRIKTEQINKRLVDYFDNSGYFFEYDCEDILSLREVCDDKRCQTIGFLGDMKELEPLLNLGISGVDRVVPIGQTMEFELIWDGYDLYSQLTRRIRIK